MIAASQGRTPRAAELELLERASRADKDGMASELRFVDIDEEVRRSRVMREYLRRGMDREAAARIYSSRQEDETPIVLASRASAEHCVRLN